MASAEWLISSGAGDEVEDASRGEATAVLATPSPHSRVATRAANWRRDPTPDCKPKRKSQFLAFSIISSTESVQQSRNAVSRKHGTTRSKYVQENIFGL